MMRELGIDILGQASWGTHLCQFYQTKEDLIEILVPYFKEGLENNEFCMWVTSAPLTGEDAKRSLQSVVKDLDSYIEKGQIEILDASQWYTKSGRFEADKVLQGWVAKEDEALKRGFDGLRGAGNTLWLEKKVWRDFADYEGEIDNVIGQYRMIVICSYSLDKCGASEVIDVLRNHQFALARQEGRWELVESAARRRAEEEKERVQARLLQAARTNAIGTLVSGVAHEFNNLLGAVQGYAELAMMQVDVADPLYADLHKIVRAAQRGAKLTRQLLLFGRKHPMEPTLLNLNRMVGHLLEMLNRLIGEDIAINIDLEPDLWTVPADEASIEQVIMNMAINAREAMPKGGELTINTENVTLDEKHCKRIPEARPGKFVCLSVADTGVGMDEETMQHIFEPFFTTKETGAGLGLSVAYGIVKQHEGWISVYSEPGQGSMFQVYLPALPIEAERETAVTISLEELQGSGERILLVEDEEDVREFLTRALRENGYVAFAAANAKEALDIFEREKEYLHLVLTDVVLPDLSGLELVDQLLSRNPQLLVLMSSGYTDDKSQWPVIRERGFPFLQKPYALADLLRVIREVIKPS
jgi:signal transduction histidine kinase